MLLHHTQDMGWTKQSPPLPSFMWCWWNSYFHKINHSLCCHSEHKVRSDLAGCLDCANWPTEGCDSLWVAFLLNAKLHNLLIVSEHGEQDQKSEACPNPWDACYRLLLQWVQHYCRTGCLACFVTGKGI